MRDPPRRKVSTSTCLVTVMSSKPNIQAATALEEGCRVSAHQIGQQAWKPGPDERDRLLGPAGDLLYYGPEASCLGYVGAVKFVHRNQ